MVTDNFLQCKWLFITRHRTDVVDDQKEFSHTVIIDIELENEVVPKCEPVIVTLTDPDDAEFFWFKLSKRLKSIEIVALEVPTFLPTVANHFLDPLIPYTDLHESDESEIQLVRSFADKPRLPRAVLKTAPAFIP
jgi:hypothetical protein